MLPVRQVVVMGIPTHLSRPARIGSGYVIESAGTPPVIDRMEAIPREGVNKGVKRHQCPHCPLRRIGAENKRWANLSSETNCVALQNIGADVTLSYRDGNVPSSCMTQILTN